MRNEPLQAELVVTHSLGISVGEVVSLGVEGWWRVIGWSPGPGAHVSYLLEAAITPCPICGGKGTEADYIFVRCEHCEGRGYFKVERGRLVREGVLHRPPRNVVQL